MTALLCPVCMRRLGGSRHDVLPRHKNDGRVCPGSGEYGLTPCTDCGKWYDYEGYMVFDYVWAQAGLSERAMCCIGCLEARLGRTLWVADFIHAPINIANEFDYELDRVMPTSDRLVNRLRRTSPDAPLESPADPCLRCMHAREDHPAEGGVSWGCFYPGCRGCYLFMLDQPRLSLPTGPVIV